MARLDYSSKVVPPVEEGVSPTLSQLRHDLRTALNHVLGYDEMLAESVTDPKTLGLLTEIRTEGKNILRMVETCLAPGEESTTPSSMLDELQTQVREPLQRLVRQSAALANDASDAILPDALQISSAASKLMSMLALGSAGVSDEVSTPEPLASDIPTPTPGSRVLVVDDDEANHDILSRNLSRQGYQVELAEGGAEALRFLRRSSYDVVLLDVKMPDVDGMAVLTEMQADPAMREIPVIMLSAFDEMSHVVSCIQAGAIDYLHKPYNPVLMKARLATTLERKRLLDEERRRSRELQSLSTELRRSNEDLERFAYAVSHDLQAPLRTMVSFMQLAQRKLRGKLDVETNQLIDDAVAAGKRMSSLVRDLLDYSQLSTRRLSAEPVVMAEVLAEIQADLLPQIEESGAEIRAGEMPVINSDRVQMRRLFQNLISNAIKYRDRDRAPQVIVTATKCGGNCEFSVSDNGIGIPAQHVSEIFQMFHRLHGTEVPGSGIGLATCARIVERFGGTISVHSEIGKGSTFRVTFPCTD